jgi:hypothetical protein
MEEFPMTQPPAYQKRIQRARPKRAQQAKQLRLQPQRERLQGEQARAPRALRALEQARQELGLPATVAQEVQWRLQAQQQLLGKLFARMFPPDVWVPQRP